MENPANSTLPRRLGLVSAAAVLIGSVIGSGIFRSPAGIAERMPGPLAMLSVWAVGGLFALCGALTLSEIASSYPKTGGMYVFIREAWGRMPGFLFGWAQIVMVRAAALGGIATVFSEYFLRVIGVDLEADGSARIVQFVAAAAVVITGSFNYFGLRYGSLVQNLTTLGKFAGLVFIIILAMGVGLPQTGGNFAPFNPAGTFALAPFGLALVSVLWAFDGWADLSFVGGEVKDPERTLPRALILGTVTVIVVYLLANIAYLSVLSIDEIRNSPLVAADVAERLMGGAGVVFVSVTVMVSTFGTLNGSILTGPRIFFAVAADRLFFRKFAEVHPRYQTPHLAIALSAALGVVYIYSLGNFQNLADAFVTAMVPFYGLSVAAIFVLRKRADFRPSFRTPLYPILPLLFIAATIFLLANALIDPGQRGLTALVLGIILAGIPVYYVIERRGRAIDG
jgi:amino acid transporter